MPQNPCEVGAQKNETQLNKGKTVPPLSFCIFRGKLLGFPPPSGKLRNHPRKIPEGLLEHPASSNQVS